MKLSNNYSNCDQLCWCASRNRSLSAPELDKERSHFIHYGGLMMDVVKRQRLEAAGWRVE
jgi:hypothetical protein